MSFHKKWYYCFCKNAFCIICNNKFQFSRCAHVVFCLLSLIFQGLMHGPPVSQLPHHDPMPSHQPIHQHQQHHRQELPHHQQQQLNVNEPRLMMLHGQNPFHQQQMHGSPRQMTSRPQNPQQRTMSNRQRMVRYWHMSSIFFWLLAVNRVHILSLGHCN